MKRCKLDPGLLKAPGFKKLNLMKIEFLSTWNLVFFRLACAPTKRRIVMEVAYDGGAFSGFQAQPPPKNTVQVAIEKAFAREFGRDNVFGRVVGASRTDGGVHAEGMVAHLDVAAVGRRRKQPPRLVESAPVDSKKQFNLMKKDELAFNLKP